MAVTNTPPLLDTTFRRAPASPALTRHTRVAVVDVRRLIADALAALVAGIEGVEISGVADSEERLGRILARPPQIVVAGVGADPDQGLALIRAVRRRAPQTAVVIVADSLAPRLVRFALEEAVSGLVDSDMPAADIAAALDQVVRGHAVLPVGWQRALARSESEPIESLSRRQREVLELLADGASNDEIARRLYISLNTVKFHVRTIYARLGVRSRLEAARCLAAAR